MLQLLKIPFIQADNEAEQLCSQLVHNNIIDYCLSDDMDVFPCGALHVLRNFKFKCNYVYKYDLQKFLDYLKINYFQFIILCILLGCDYIKISLKKNYKKNLNLIQYLKQNIKSINDLHKLSAICLKEIDLPKLINIVNIFEINYQPIDFNENFFTLNYHYNNELFLDILNTFFKNQNITINVNSKIKSFLKYIHNINKSKNKKYNNKLYNEP